MAKFTITLPHADKNLPCEFEEGRDGKYRASNESLLALGIKSLTFEGVDSRTKSVERLLLKVTEELQVEEDIGGGVSTESNTAHAVISRSTRTPSAKLLAARGTAEELSTALIGVLMNDYLCKQAFTSINRATDNPVARIRRKLMPMPDGQSGHAALIPHT